MRCLELFAGAGGAALGLEAAGFEHAALCEWDADACATMRAAGLGPVVEGDVRDLDAIAETVGGQVVDLLWSSFPCQAWSVAGDRRGAEDERNGWPWTVDAIDRFRPRWFLAENVRGLLMHSSDGHPDPRRCPRCYFERVILAELRERFAFVGWWLLDAADFGVPQHRRRVIVWAGPAPLRAPVATHGDPSTARQGSLFGRCVQPWRTMGDALGLSSGQRVVGGGGNPHSKDAARERNYRDLTSEPSTTVAAVQVGNAGPWVVAAGVTGEGRPRPMTAASPTIGTKGTAYLLDSPAPTVLATEAKGHTNPDRDRGRSGPVGRAADALYLATGRRRLTVAECAALQGFPTGHPWRGTKTAQYRQVGNAVPPMLAQVVGECVIRAERDDG